MKLDGARGWHVQQRVILLMVISVIEENVKDHAAKEFAHLQRIRAQSGLPGAAQDLRKRRVAQVRILRRDRAKRGTGRNRVHAPAANSIKATNGNGMFAPQRDDLSFGNLDASLSG